MCGITAAITLQRSDSANRNRDSNETNGAKSKAKKISEHGTLRQQFQQSLEAIAHRGPDASGVWISDDATVGMESPLVGMIRKQSN